MARLSNLGLDLVSGPEGAVQSGSHPNPEDYGEYERNDELLHDRTSLKILYGLHAVVSDRNVRFTAYMIKAYSNEEG